MSIGHVPSPYVGCCEELMNYCTWKSSTTCTGDWVVGVGPWESQKCWYLRQDPGRVHARSQEACMAMMLEAAVGCQGCRQSRIPSFLPAPLSLARNIYVLATLKVRGTECPKEECGHLLASSVLLRLQRLLMVESKGVHSSVP